MALRDPSHLIDTVRPTGVRYALAARITGPAKTAFPKAPGAVQQGNVQLLIVADSDVWDDRFWVHVTNQLGRTSGRALRRQWRLDPQRGGESHRLGRSDFACARGAPATVHSPSCRPCARARKSNTARPRTGCRPTSPRRKRRWSSCSAAPAATPSPCRQKQKDEIEALRRGHGGNARPVARRSAQSARRCRCAGHPPRLLNIFGVPILVAAFALVLG